MIPLQVRSFFRKLFLFLLIFALLDFMAGSALRYFYFRVKSGLYARTTYALNSVDKDLLIFGSSRACDHYSSQTIEKEWGPSFYNVGEGGQRIFYHLSLLRGILKRYSPKVIILNLDFDDFDTSREAYDRLSALLPYYRPHPEIRDIIDLKSKFEKFKRYSQIYPFNSMIFSIVAGDIFKRSLDDRGYEPLYHVWEAPLEKKEFKQTAVDEVKVKAYQDFISEAVGSGAHVFVVVGPYYIKFNFAGSPTLKIASLIAQKNGAVFIDYSQDKIFLDHREFFYNADHLNDQGAKVFTKIVISAVKRDL